MLTSKSTAKQYEDTIEHTGRIRRSLPGVGNCEGSLEAGRAEWTSLVGLKIEYWTSESFHDRLLYLVSSSPLSSRPVTALSWPDGQEWATLVSWNLFRI